MDLKGAGDLARGLSLAEQALGEQDLLEVELGRVAEADAALLGLNSARAGALPDEVALERGERNAAKPWLVTHGGCVKDLRPIYLGDDLFACQPIAEAVTTAGGDFLLTAKPSSHKALYDFMDGATIEKRTIKEKIGSKRLTYCYRWFEQAPIRDKDAILVNWLGVTITDAKGKVTYDNAFVTSLPVTRDTVAEIVACARARWKSRTRASMFSSATVYQLEHNFGHGKQNLAMVFAAMNLLAFAIHTACDCLEQVWIAARTAKRARKRFFEHIRTITAYLVFPDWQT